MPEVTVTKVAGAPPDQMRGEGVDHPDGAEQVGVDRPLGRPEVRGVAQILHEHDARHRHHRVQPGVPGEYGVADGRDRGAVGDVDGKRAEPLRGEFAERFGVTAADGHGAARRGEPPGQFPPDARGPADDEDGAVREVHEVFLPVQAPTACPPCGPDGESAALPHQCYRSRRDIGGMWRGPGSPWS